MDREIIIKNLKEKWLYRLEKDDIIYNIFWDNHYKTYKCVFRDKKVQVIQNPRLDILLNKLEEIIQ